MSKPVMKTEGQLFNGCQNTAREYRRAWARHGNPERCCGLAPASITLDDIKGTLEEMRAVNDGNPSPSLFHVFAEEFLEMYEAAFKGDYKAFRNEMDQCHAVLERIDDFYKAMGVSHGNES